MRQRKLFSKIFHEEMRATRLATRLNYNCRRGRLFNKWVILILTSVLVQLWFLWFVNYTKIELKENRLNIKKLRKVVIPLSSIKRIDEYSDDKKYERGILIYYMMSGIYPKEEVEKIRENSVVVGYEVLKDKLLKLKHGDRLNEFNEIIKYVE